MANRYKYTEYMEDEPRADLLARVPKPLKEKWVAYFNSKGYTQARAILEALELWHNLKEGKIRIVSNTV